MNKFNIGDEVVYRLKGKINKIERLGNRNLYQFKEQNKDVWLEEENIEYERMYILKAELERFHLLSPEDREKTLKKLTKMHQELQRKGTF